MKSSGTAHHGRHGLEDERAAGSRGTVGQLARDFLRRAALALPLLASAPLAAGAPFSDPPEDHAPTDESSLEGLWLAKRDFGPEVQGTLTLIDREGKLSAEIAGFRVPVRRDGERLTFELAGDRGAFRGRLREEGGEVVGHWIQPATVANGVRWASPVHLAPLDLGRWRGRVTPLDDTMTFFLRLKRAEDGSLAGFFRNPEANLGQFMQFERLEQDGDSVRFLGEAGGEPLLTARFHREPARLSIDIARAGGTYDFVRVEDDPASPFYPRARDEGPYSYRPPLPEEDGWETASLEEVGMSVGPIRDLIQGILDTPQDSLSAPYFHAVLVARHGQLVLEEYFHGHSAGVPHDTRSAGKSVISTLIGIAIHDGADLSLLSPVYETLTGEPPPPDLDPRKARMTLGHLLTMSSGLSCDDDDPASPGNEFAMQTQSEDWARFALELPMLHEPGEVVAYCGASIHLASAMLSRATRTWLPEFYEEHFARPLGMGLYHINLSPTGQAYGGGGLQMRARDLLKMGQLFLEGGRRGDARLLSPDWVEEAQSPGGEMFGQGYGYGWWTYSYPFREGKVDAFYASGNGGQYLFVVPDLDLVAVFFAANYGQPVPIHRIRRELFPGFVLSAVVR